MPQTRAQHGARVTLRNPWLRRKTPWLAAFLLARALVDHTAFSWWLCSTGAAGILFYAWRIRVVLTPAAALVTNIRTRTIAWEDVDSIDFHASTGCEAIALVLRSGKRVRPWAMFAHRYDGWFSAARDAIEQHWQGACPRRRYGERPSGQPTEPLS